MSLWNDVRQILSAFADEGWHALLLRHGLDIKSANLQQELQRDLANSIDRTGAVRGFADFASDGRRGVEPGDPARSLLYHAFASPLVHPTADGSPAGNGAYLALEQLDVIENYIYALGAAKLSISDLALAVFAYEYRPAAGTPHGVHADLVFSRTGIARNGTQEARFNGPLRCYQGVADAATDCLVSPARYGVFLARRQTGRFAWTPQKRTGTFSLSGGARPGDADREFLIPVHKLFDGPECLPPHTLTVEYHHRHVNEKLHRAATISHGVQLADGFDTSAFPFIIVSDSTAKPGGPPSGQIALKPLNGSALVQPRAGDLIAYAKQPSRSDGSPRLVTFEVNKESVPKQINRSHTSFRIAEDWLALAAEGVDSVLSDVFAWLGVGQQFPRPRNAPEFVNIRHKVDDRGNVADMRSNPPSRDDFLKEVRDGDYAAAMFVDGCADGCVTARITAADAIALPPLRPAFSVVAAPDFFPSIDQMELMTWLKDNKIDSRDQFRQGGPDPLSLGRLPANQGMADPLSNKPAFADRDQTMVAMVAVAPRGTNAPAQSGDISDRTSFLSDASSSVFAPGWDVTYASNGADGPFYATYGLGSPFPEDAKLCAAENAFWPAVSPDASRTFGTSNAPTAMPLMDAELGYHDDHPWVRSGRVAGGRGWDGEQGPFLTDDGMNVNYADIERSDYVSNMLSGTVSFGQLAVIDADEMGQRMKALRVAIAAADNGATPAKTKLWLVSAEPVPSWSVQTNPGPLTGKGYRFVFAMASDPSGDGAETGETLRLRKTTTQIFRCRVDSQGQKQVDRAIPGAGALAFYNL